MQPCLDEGFLGGILRNLCIAAHAVDDVPHTVGVDADQFAKGIPVAILRHTDKLFFPGCEGNRQREQPFYSMYAKVPNFIRKMTNSDRRKEHALRILCALAGSLDVAARIQTVSVSIDFVLILPILVRKGEVSCPQN